MRQPDFEADIRFLTREEGGRDSLPVQGYRPDIVYEKQEEDGIWMVWPMFLDESGNELPKGQSVMQKGKANMYIINDELRKTVHRERIREGVCFHLVEGRKVVADGTVTRIFGLFED